MKIAYVFAYFGDGGAEEHAILLARHAKLSGNEPVFIISRTLDSAKQRLASEGFEVICLSMESSFNPVSVSKSSFGLKKIIQNEKIDIIHTHMLREHSLAIMTKMLGVRFGLIRTFHRFDQFNAKMGPVMGLYRKYTDAFIAISDSMKDYLHQNGIIDEVFLVNNGVKKVEAKKHDSAIGFIGRLTPEKGIFRFIEANAELLRKQKLVIAGDGPDFEKINQYIKNNKLNVEMMGNVTDKAKFFERISVLILSSDTEVMPLVILEAYSCGLPVVGFDHESLKNIIKKENGEIVKYPDYVKMGDIAVKLILSSKDYYEKNVSLYMSNYSDGVMWNETYKVYQAAIKRS